MNMSQWILKLQLWSVFAVFTFMALFGCAQSPVKKQPTKTLLTTGPTIFLSVEDTLIHEKAGRTNTKVIATLNTPSKKVIKLMLKVSGSATALYDYTLPLTMTIPAGEQSVSAILVALDDDPLDEANETVIIEIESVTHATEKPDTKPLIVTIINESPLPTVELSVNNSSLHEKTAPTSTNVTAILSAVSGRDVTIALAVSGTADPQIDHTLPKTVTLTIPAGRPSAVVHVDAKNDDPFDEENETIILDIANVVNGTELEKQQKTITLVDESPLPTVILLVGNSNINERMGITSTVVQATLSAVSAKVVTVTLASSGTASASDYTLPLEIKIPPGMRSASVILSALGDNLPEPDKTVIIDITNVQNGTEKNQQQETVVITDQ